jgi:hypothetical protein
VHEVVEVVGQHGGGAVGEQRREARARIGHGAAAPVVETLQVVGRVGEVRHQVRHRTQHVAGLLALARLGQHHGEVVQQLRVERLRGGFAQQRERLSAIVRGVQVERTGVQVAGRLEHGQIGIGRWRR